MVVYSSAAAYIESCKTLRDKIIAIDAIIAALMTTALLAATNDNISQYSLNDGQTIINTSYRGVAGITKSIMDMEALKQLYLNRLNGRMTRLVDSKNFPGPGYYNGK